MIKQVVLGRATRIVSNKIIVRRGDAVDVYNTEYYRIADEPVSGIGKETKRNEQSTALAESRPPVPARRVGGGTGASDVRSAAGRDGITIGGLGMRELIRRRWYGLRRFVWWVFVDDGYKCE